MIRRFSQVTRTTLMLVPYIFLVAFGTSVHRIDFKSLLSSPERQTGAVNPTPLPALPEDSPITIAAVGDIMMGSTFPDDSRLPPDDGRHLLDAMRSALHGADVVFGNLEGPLLEGGVSSKCPPLRTSGNALPIPRLNCYAFRLPPEYGDYLKQAGFNVLSLANNHAGDFGDVGRISTGLTLDKLGFSHVGSDRARFASTIVEIKGRRIGLVGFAHNDVVPNVNDVDAARKLVSDLKRRADLVIVSFHGGAEGVTHQHVPYETEIFFGEPRGNLRLFTHAVIDAGADLVLGHGPHVLRGLELYKGHLIIYSMGNFCTYGWFSLKQETCITAVYQLTLGSDGRFLGGRLVPGKQVEPGGPIPDPSGEPIRIVRHLSAVDFNSDTPSIADDGRLTPQPHFSL